MCIIILLKILYVTFAALNDNLEVLKWARYNCCS